MIKSQYFCFVSDSVAQDKNLSLKAKGLYLLIQSCIESPEFDFSHYKPELEAKCKEGSKAFDSAWKELKKAGYLKQHRIPSGKSGTFCYEYELLDDAAQAALEIISHNQQK